VVTEFERENDCEVDLWYNDMMIYLKTKYRCDYWEREEQYGGPCFVFQDERDSTYFMLKFE
jgi:hypothetical protein